MSDNVSDSSSNNRLRWVLGLGVFAAALAFFYILSRISAAIFPIGHGKNIGEALVTPMTMLVVYAIWAPLNAQVRKSGWVTLKIAVFLFLLSFAIGECIDYFKG